MPKPLLRLATVIICAFGLWGGLLVPSATGQVQALDSVRDDIVIETLDNGLTVVVAPRAGSSVATVEVWIGVGSAQEPTELNGIAHFFEHMIFKGSTRFQDVDTVVEGWGGSSNASTSFDFTNYYVSVPQEYAEASIDLVADILINGLFPEEELIKERDVVLREGDQRNDNPDSYLFYQVWDAYYGQHPYGQPILGTEETVSSITRDDFLNWLGTYYVPNNMTVVVAGGVDPDRVLTQIQSSFGGMEAKDLPAFEPSNLEPGSGVEEMFLSREVEQERLFMAWPAPPVEEFDDVVSMGRASVLAIGQPQFTDLSQHHSGSRGHYLGRFQLLHHPTASHIQFECTISAGRDGGGPQFTVAGIGPDIGRPRNSSRGGNRQESVGSLN